jgi:uncharacterized protein YcsI (UPF0317 family)
MNEKIARGTGAENTLYDKRRHEMMKLRPIGRFYGNTIVGLRPIDDYPICGFCKLEINVPHVIIFKVHYHNGCYLR